MGQNYYDLLGLPGDATTEEIRKAYFEAARRFHPDTTHDESSNELFISIQEAYETLRNPRRRSAYDAAMEKTSVAAAIGVQWYTSRASLARLNEDQIFYALGDFTCQAELSRANNVHVNLAVVIDRSTSMQGARMEMVRSNLLKIFSILQPQDILSIVVFSDRAEVLIPATRVSKILPHDPRLSVIKTGGGTEIYQGLHTGVEQIRGVIEPHAVRHLILITDGNTYGDDAACLALAEQARAEGITINALGIGHEWNDVFLDKMVSLSGGSSAYISSGQDLQVFLENTLRNASAVYARGLMLSFRTSPFVQLRSAFRMGNDLTPLPIGSPIALGNLHYGRSTSVIMEFLINPIPSGSEQLRLLNGRLQMEVFEPLPGEARVPVSVNALVKEHVSFEAPPPRILDALSRITLYRMQEKAHEELSEGDISGASRRLQHLANHLLTRGSHNLARTVLEEAENIRHSQHFSKEGDKRIKYGTRSLSLPVSRSFDDDDLSRL